MTIVLTQDEVYGHLRTLVEAVVAPFPYVEAWRDGMRPHGGHLEYREISDRVLSAPSQCDDLQTTTRELRLDLRAFGAAHDLLRRIESVLQSTRHELHRALSAAGVSVRQVGPVQDATAIRAGDYERVKLMQLRLGYVEQFDSPDAPNADSVTLDITGHGGIETGPHTIPLTVSDP